MLNSDTKRHIDAARDCLVGKVPNPISQIEQITNALIYKFMCDMDEVSVSEGGVNTFFNNELADYKWSRLMDTAVGAQKRFNMYEEAFKKLSKSEHIPKLFRDIIKDARLPYNDPQTLDLFLKEINHFHYHHSEELGNAFEYLLSIMGSQGDAGQFRTPRHIIDFIVEILEPNKDDRILDPSCGTAGFLISAYKYIMANHDGIDNKTEEKSKKEKRLSFEEKQKVLQNIQGYDISPEMTKLAKVNMYLHGAKTPNIQDYDTLTSEKNWDEMFDCVLANPPFMTPKGGIRPHQRFSIKANRAEVLFVDYIVEHLKTNGRAGIIVPEGIIFQSANAYKDLRKLLLENGLYSVVSLPGGVFNPYAGVKTSILLIDKRLKNVKDFLFIEIKNDGFDLGANRRPIDKNDLPEAIELIKNYRNNLLEKKK